MRKIVLPWSPMATLFDYRGLLKRLCSTTMLMLTITTGLYAGSFGSSAKGTTTAGFLKLGVGARSAGLGEAYSAMVDEASALYWNPAGLNRIKGKSVTLMHAAYLDNSFFDYAAYGQSLGKLGAFGIGIQYLSAGRITETDPSGSIIGDFNPSDLAVSIGYAEPIGSYHLGFAFKYIRSVIIDQAKAVAVDFGLLSPAYFGKRLRLAFTATNLGPQMKFEEKKEDLPLALRTGSSLKITNSWQWGLDFAFPKDNNPYTAIGTEYNIHISPSMGLATRVGFNSRTLGDVDGVTGITTGLGLTYQKFAIDYGFVPFGSVGLTHRISLTMGF